MDKKNVKPHPKYYLNKQGQFVVENYNYAKPFANFFPGISGRHGIPMWVFYVNRGQCIASFGIKDKDQSILEFFPANKAWQLVSSQGFRTFLKIKTSSGSIFYEPFHNGYNNLKFKITNSMVIASSHLFIEEENRDLGIKTRVEYFNLPNDTYAGLCRKVCIENTGKKYRDIQVIDGLPQITAFGINNFFLKEMGRTIEAWISIDNLDRSVPFYRLAVDPADKPEVIHIDGGNFYLGFSRSGGKTGIIRPIVDPEAVFGEVTDFSYPAEFLSHAAFTYPKKQATKGKTPCAFLLADMQLKPGEIKTLHSIAGQARNMETLNKLIPRIIKPGYAENKFIENAGIVEELKKDVFTASSSEEFNLYAGQTYLDNIMRGGYPEIFKSGMVFYLYSRKHGDLERDYNKFQIQPTYLSQGNGNYRDVNQNRRSDCWFNPEVKDENVVYFMNLIQADGFNPLVVKPDTFRLKEGTHVRSLLEGVAADEDIAKFEDYFKDKKSFTPGKLLLFAEDNGFKLKKNYDEFLDRVLAFSSRTQEADHSEGFWTDHWTYNLDLIDSYLGLYPDKHNELFFGKKVFTFYDNAETVRPRGEKYVLYNGKPRQLHCLALDAGKKEMLRRRKENPCVMRTHNGSGDIYYTTLIVKLLCLAVNKLASLDPYGMGIEMEAGKPNWFDSLNGLPALFGSSTCETFELKRLMRMIKNALQVFPGEEIEAAEEIACFIRKVHPLLPEETFSYWDKSNEAKENYRHTCRMGFSGSLVKIPVAELVSFIDAAAAKVEKGLNLAFDEKRGTYNAYFMNELVEYEVTGSSCKEQCIKPLKFKQVPLPLFLEGQMHALRLCEDPKEAGDIHGAVKKSALFDKKLRMYKVTAALKPMPEEIGRCRVFTPGWLENESIWLHMEYKYFLELLKTGLAKEFYAELKNVFIPFQDPRRYGRSILENSSFLTSSAFPDKKLQGNGFVARLSGSTAEFLHIWLIMNTGGKPFYLDDSGRLNLSLKPILPAWLFRRRKEYSFNFLGNIPVTYHNPGGKDTFGKNAARTSRIVLWKNNTPLEFDSGTIPHPYAQEIRSRKFNKIDIYLE
jgi:hypothetical protein